MSMIEKLKGRRELLAWILMGLIVLGMAVALWRLISSLWVMSVFAAFQVVGIAWLNIALALLLVLVVLSCSFVAPATPRAVPITRLATVLLVLGAALTLVSALMGMWASAMVAGTVLDLVGGLLDTAVKAVMAAVLWSVLRGIRGGRLVAAPAADTPGSAPLADSVAAPADPSAGTVWWTAADAAAGSPGRDRMPSTEDSPSGL